MSVTDEQIRTEARRRVDAGSNHPTILDQLTEAELRDLLQRIPRPLRDSDRRSLGYLERHEALYDAIQRKVQARRDDRTDLSGALEAFKTAALQLERVWLDQDAETIDGYPENWHSFEETAAQIAGMRLVPNRQENPDA